MRFGAALHDALLLPNEFPMRYVEEPILDRRTKEGKIAFQEFQTEHVGKSILSPLDMARIRGMVESARKHRTAGALIEAGVSELSCFWDDEETLLPCKARPDLLIDSTIIDIKTTRDASHRAFQKSVASYRYHVQAAWYLDGVSKFQPAERFIIISIESEPPYATAIYELDHATIEAGRAAYRKDLEKLNQCKQVNKWPAYGEEIETINLPHWAWEE
jgi:exodeoxyribonuclease VIII